MLPKYECLISIMNQHTMPIMLCNYTYKVKLYIQFHKILRLRHTISDEKYEKVVTMNLVDHISISFTRTYSSFIFSTFVEFTINTTGVTQFTPLTVFKPTQYFP